VIFESGEIVDAPGGGGRFLSSASITL
jgi:hypothetical protein